MRIYHGSRDANRNAIVFVTGDGDRRRLPLRLDLDNHSPTGFEWGYGGSGPAQLALALIADATGDDELAIKLHQQFKRKVVGGLPSVWCMSDAMVKDAVATIWAGEDECSAT
jgi:hypothetical protein